VIDNTFTRTIKESISINGYALLLAEQKLLDKAKNDAMCLNNNEIAYVPNWITAPHKEKFEKFLKDRSIKKHDTNKGNHH
jgi:hypothetical protein